MRRSLVDIYNLPLYSAPGASAYTMPQVPQVQVPGIPGSALLPNQQLSEELKAYLKQKLGTREYSEEKTLLPEDLEQQARMRLKSSPEYSLIEEAMKNQSDARQAYMNYLKGTEDTDRKLRAASTISRGLASLLDKPELAGIIQAPLTPEQKYADQQKLLADQYTTSGTPLSLLNDYIKNRLSGKTTITDTTGFESGSQADVGRQQDNLPRNVGRRGSGKPVEMKDLNREYQKVASDIAYAQNLAKLVPDVFNPDSIGNDLPGYTGIAGRVASYQGKGMLADAARALAKSTMSKQELDVRQTVAGLVNSIRKGLFGSALSEGERIAFADQLEAGINNEDGAAVRTALVNLIDTIRARAEVAERAFPNQSAAWVSQGNKLKTQEIDELKRGSSTRVIPSDEGGKTTAQKPPQEKNQLQKVYIPKSKREKMK